MSMHKIELTKLERDGLNGHHLIVDAPSQLSDAFRLGIKWAQDNKPQSDLISVADLISSLRNTDPYIRTIYSEGGCYKFHLFLKSVYPNAKPLINKDNNHVVSFINGVKWDIDGLVSWDEIYRPVDDLRLVESWGFANRMLLSLGECEFCEEPILIASTPPKQ